MNIYVFTLYPRFTVAKPASQPLVWIRGMTIFAYSTCIKIALSLSLSLSLFVCVCGLASSASPLLANPQWQDDGQCLYWLCFFDVDDGLRRFLYRLVIASASSTRAMNFSLVEKSLQERWNPVEIPSRNPKINCCCCCCCCILLVERCRSSSSRLKLLGYVLGGDCDGFIMLVLDLFLVNRKLVDVVDSGWLVAYFVSLARDYNDFVIDEHGQTRRPLGFPFPILKRIMWKAQKFCGDLERYRFNSRWRIQLQVGLHGT